MSRLKVRDVMTDKVACVHVDAGFKEMVATLARWRVSALPVLDTDGRVVGVISEADLLLKQEYQEADHEPRPPRWRHRRARRKAAAATAEALMSAPALVVDPDESVVHAARMLTEHNIRRLPVVDAERRLVGIVSRRDLLGVFLRSDEQIAAEISARVLPHLVGTNPALVKVRVKDGRVGLTGEVEARSWIPVTVALTEAVDGVVDVEHELGYIVDDRYPAPHIDTSKI